MIPYRQYVSLVLLWYGYRREDCLRSGCKAQAYSHP